MRKMKQLKILLVANVTKEHVLKFHLPTIKKLKEEGWIVDVASGGAENIPYCDRHIILPIDRSPFKGNIIKGISLLKKEIAENSYDIVYCHTEVGGIVGRLAARTFRKKGVKVVKLDHGFYFYKGASWLTWAIHYPIDKLLSKITDTFITINKEDYNVVNKHFKSCKSFIIDGIGVDPSRFVIDNREQVRMKYRKDMNIPQNAIVLVYLAELIENKNQTFLMDALKQALCKRKDIYLVLAGIDHTEGRFEKYAEEIGIKNNVRFLGWRSDVNNLYAMSDICTASSIREGFGLNLVEAMYCELPVIASKNRGHATIIRDGENGFLVNLGDVSEFANRIVLLADNADLRKQFVEVSNKEITKFSSDTIVTKLYYILKGEL